MSDNKINVALCLSGYPRFHSEKSYQSMKREILDKYNTDVFIHSWVSRDIDYVYPFATWSNILNPIHIPSTIHDDLKKIYNPVDIIIEEPRSFSQFSKDDYLSNNMPSMFYSLKMADSMRFFYSRYTGKKYDFVVRARTDTLLYELPDLSSLDINTIYIPDNCGNPLLFNDNFSICGGDIVDKNQVYNVFDDIWEYSNRGEDYSPEKMWTLHLSKKLVKVDLLNVRQDFVRNWDKSE